MSGGAKEHITDIIKKYIQPIGIYVGLALVLGITYVKQIPSNIRFQANTMLGRTFLFLVTFVIADMYSWNYGLMAALLTVLMLAISPHPEGIRLEGFEDNTDIKLVSEKHRWFIEKALNEHPAGISEDKVKTSAIQDQGNTKSASTE
jgi:hypothetical protein